MKKSISSTGAPAAIGPYSQAILAGGFLFCSGQIALRPDGTFVGRDIRAQATQALENLRAVLKAAGLTFEHVVRVTIYLTDLKDFEILNEVYGSFVGSTPPARETVQVAALPKGAAVEISAIAVVDLPKEER